MGAAVMTAAVAVAMLATGIAHALGLSAVGPVTVLALHIALALALLPLVAMHVINRPQRPRRGDLTRAGFLRVAGFAVLAVGRQGGVRRHARRLPGGHRLAAPRPAHADLVAERLDARRSDAGEWGDRLAGLPPREVTCALDCTSGWYSVNRWSGVAVADLLGPLPPGTRSVLVSSHTGYSRRFDAADLAAAAAGDRPGRRALPRDNGGPARLVVPGQPRLLVGEVGAVDRAERAGRPGGSRRSR